jgi:hypothetical protein
MSYPPKEPGQQATIYECKDCGRLLWTPTCKRGRYHRVIPCGTYRVLTEAEAQRA